MLLGRLATIQGSPIPPAPIVLSPVLTPPLSLTPHSYPVPLLSATPPLSLPSNIGIVTSNTIFIGIRREVINLRQSFLERNIELEDRPSIGTALLQIIARNESPVSRILSKWPLDRQTWVSMSSTPIDIGDDNYSDYSTNFRNVGTLKTILDAPDQSPVMFPASPSSTLDSFLGAMSLPNQPVFVIYVCAQVRSSLSFFQVTHACRRTYS